MARDYKLRERIPHTYLYFNDNSFNSNFSVRSCGATTLRTTSGLKLWSVMFGGLRFSCVHCAGKMTLFGPDDENISSEKVSSELYHTLENWISSKGFEWSNRKILQWLIQVSYLTDYRLRGNNDFKCHTIQSIISW